jgi:5,10-methylenetetrahydromethanopterin reductase
MASVKEFGLALEMADASEVMRSAGLAEQVGFGSFWILEDPFFHGAFSLATAVACQTESLRIGISIINPYTRHPAVTAMEFATLDEISRGRAVLGVGAGAPFWIKDQLHLTWERPAGRAIREAVDLIRRLVRGEQVTSSGQIFRVTDAMLHFPPLRSSPPIYLGVTGPKNLQMAGAIADGVILSTMSSPAYVRFAREQVRLGAQRAGRTLEGFEISAILPISISQDETLAREAVKPILAVLLGLGVPDATSPILRCVDFPEARVHQFRERFANGDIPVDLVDEDMVDTFTIAGSPRRCVKKMREFIEAGLDTPIAYEIPGVTPERTILNVKEHLFAEFV